MAKILILIVCHLYVTERQRHCLWSPQQLSLEDVVQSVRIVLTCPGTPSPHMMAKQEVNHL
jgi:hypothetical protein